MYDGLYGQFNGPGLGWGSNTLVGDADFLDVWCGGLTSSFFDDFVDFHTDKGLFSVDPLAMEVQQLAVNLAAALGYFYPPSLDVDCSEGRNVDIEDIDALSVWGAFLSSWQALEGGCDVDGWRNGVVTTRIVPSGDVGVATIRAQQGGGLSPLRTVNLTFLGEAALSLFIDLPAEVRPPGADFSIVVIDQDGRPIGSEGVECSVSPADGPFVLLDASATTGPDGMAAFSLVPTGVSYSPGLELTITCWLSGDPLVSATENVICLGPCGDANNDGAVDAVDALFVLQYVVGVRSGDDACAPGSGVVCLRNSDVDCDGDEDAVDALFILQFVVYLRPDLCACPS
jgi:hypothetical protein